MGCPLRRRSCNSHTRQEAVTIRFPDHIEFSRRYPHELTGARDELVVRDLIAYQGGIYQVLQLPSQLCTSAKVISKCPPAAAPSRSGAFQGATGPHRPGDPTGSWKSLRQLLSINDAAPEE